MLHSDQTRPGHLLRMYMTTQAMDFAVLFNIFMEHFFKTNIPQIELGELHQTHRYSNIQSLYSMLRFRQGHLNEALMITKGT